MHRSFSVLLLAAGLLVACSDDTVTKDTGVTPDKPVTIPDKGPGSDAVVKSDARRDGTTTTRDGSGGCATPTAKVETFAPKTNEAAGWAEALSKGAGVESGYTFNDIDDIIDGHQDPFEKEGCNGFVREYYSKGNGTLVLMLWEMKTAAGAKNMYNYWKTKDETEGGWTFTQIPNAPEMSVIGKDASYNIYGYKCQYMWEIHGTGPNFGPYPDATAGDAAKPDLIAFVQYLAGTKLPK